MVNSFNEAFEVEDLAEAHKQSITTLFFKKGERERDELKMTGLLVKLSVNTII